MITITKSWEWTEYGDGCKIRSANLCIFIMGLCQVVGGLTAILTLGFVLPQLDMAFMMWNIKHD